jgi:hypothetical protein
MRRDGENARNEGGGTLQDEIFLTVFPVGRRRTRGQVLVDLTGRVLAAHDVDDEAEAANTFRVSFNRAFRGAVLATTTSTRRS